MPHTEAGKTLQEFINKQTTDRSIQGSGSVIESPDNADLVVRFRVQGKTVPDLKLSGTLDIEDMKAEVSNKLDEL